MDGSNLLKNFTPADIAGIYKNVLYEEANREAEDIIKRLQTLLRYNSKNAKPLMKYMTLTDSYVVNTNINPINLAFLIDNGFKVYKLRCIRVNSEEWEFWIAICWDIIDFDKEVFKPFVSQHDNKKIAKWDYQELSRPNTLLL